MFDLLRKLFIKNYDNIGDSKVREKYGTVCSIYSIVCNVIMVIIKLIIATITNSVSIRADAFNNLSDVGSNVATFFGFKLANKHADADHPYGHGRYEYLSGLVISVLILVMGFESLKESILKIINKETINFGWIAIFTLSISIVMKLNMWLVNKKAGNLVESETLLAASQDSLNDSLMTLSTVISLLFFVITKINIDAYIGVVVSILVLKSGIEILMNVLSMILGQAPDPDLIKDIEEFVKSDNKIMGVHDMMFHDYGPSSRFLTFHAEVDAKRDILEIHDDIDNIEGKILAKYGILTTIHMDPVDTTNPMFNELKELTEKVLKEVNPVYSFHDFRIVTGPTHTNLVFDLLIPAGITKDHEDIRKEVCDAISAINPNYHAVIKVEHSFIN